MIYVYIHGGGFGGGSFIDSAYKELCTLLKDDQVIPVDFPLSYRPLKAIEHIKNFIKEIRTKNPNETIIPVGISSGGWFALQIGKMSEIDGLICLASNGTIEYGITRKEDAFTFEHHENVLYNI